MVRVHAGPLGGTKYELRGTKPLYIVPRPSYFKQGGLAQLARAPALQAGGHRFESDILHGEAEREEEVRATKTRLLKRFNENRLQ